MHLARTHADIWRPRCDRVEKLCKTQTAAISSPCHLCGSVSTAPKAHVSTCPVLFQSILLELLINGGLGQASGAGPVQTPVALLPVRMGQTSQAMDVSTDNNRERPSKRQKPWVTQDRQGRRGYRRQQDGKAQGQGKQQESDEMQQRLEATAKLSLRIAEAQQLLLDCGFTWFVDTEPGSILPVMFNISKEWRRIQSTTPEQASKPLYITMDGVHPDRAQGQDFENNPGSISEGGGGVSRSVHGKRPMGVQMMEPGPTLVLMDAQPLPTQTLANMLDAMLQHIQEPGALRKFHASRQLQEDMTGHKAEVCFAIQVALRGQAAERRPAWCRCVIAWPSGYPRAGCDRKGAKLQGWQKWWRIFYADSH